MHKFQCKYIYEDGSKKTWTGQWNEVVDSSETIELLIQGRGSAYQAVLGISSVGNYLCIPSVNVGCSLACWSDLFWNTEQIARVLNITDAVTIATALVDYDKFGKSECMPLCD